MTEKTFLELAKDPVGTKYLYEPVNIGPEVILVILRGPAALCAYIGIAKTHPLAGKIYDDVPIDCHGGLTYSDDKLAGKDDGHYWWYGWDYAHCGDANFYDLLPEIQAIKASYDNPKEHGWTVPEVRKDCDRAIASLKELLK